MIKESGIVERLREMPSSLNDALRRMDAAATLIAELQAEQDRINAELDTSNNNHRSMARQLAETGARALAAESSLHRVRGETIEECAVQVECTDWIMPLQGKKEVDEFGKHVAVLTLNQAARGVRQILTHCMDEEGA